MIQSLAERGRFAEAARYEAEMIRLAEPTPISMALFAASVPHLLKGDWAQALLRIERWVAVARKGNFSFHLSWGLASSAWPMAQLGEASEALIRLRESEPLLERLAAGGLLASLAWFYYSLARACLLLGQRDEARRLGDRALEFCSSQPGFEARALHLLGDVAAHPDQFDAERGETYYPIARRWPSPSGPGCAPSSPTATSVSARSTSARARASRRRSTSRRRGQCTATWA